MKLFRTESLARTRRRIKVAIREDNQRRIFDNIMRDGFLGYNRDSKVYTSN